MATALGRVAARHLDQLLLQVPPDLDLVRAGRLSLAVEGRQEALRDEALANTSDSPEAGAEGHNNVLVGAAWVTKAHTGFPNQIAYGIPLHRHELGDPGLEYDPFFILYRIIKLLQLQDRLIQRDRRLSNGIAHLLLEWRSRLCFFVIVH